MSRRQLITGFAASIAVFMFLLLSYLQRLDPLAVQAAQVEKSLQAQEAVAASWLEQDSLWSQIALQRFAHSRSTALPESMAFFLFERDSLVFWSQQGLRNPGASAEGLFQPLGAMPHYLIRRSKGTAWPVTAALPIDGRLLPTAVQSPFPVRRSSGEIAFYLSEEQQPPLPLRWQRIGFIAKFLLWLALLVLLWQASQSTAERFSPWAGLLVACAGSALWLRYGSSGDYPDLTYWQGLLGTPIGRMTLAQLMQSALLLLGLLSLAQHLLPVNPLLAAKLWHRALSSGLGYFSIVAGLLGCGAVSKTLLLDSSLVFDFSNVLTLSGLELSAIAAIVLLLIVLLLYSLWVVRGLHQLELPRNLRLLTLAGAILLSAPLAWALELGLGLPLLLLIPLLYVLLLDLFVELEAGSPAWFILWLALLSAYAAGLLFKYNLDRGQSERLAYANTLVTPVDTLAEASLSRLLAHLQAQGTEADSLSGLLYRFPYLEKNFTPHFLPVVAQQALSGDFPELGFARLPPNPQYFTYGLAWPGSDSLLAFRPVLQASRRVLRELVPAAPQQSSRYSVSLFLDTALIAQRGYFLRDWLSPALWPAAGQYRESLSSKRANLYYRAPGGYAVAVGEELGGYVKPISLFSYLFALLTLMALLLFGLNRFLGFLPATPGQLVFGAPSLRHRMQLSIIGLTFFAFLFISAVTVASLRQSSLEYQGERLLEKVDVLLRDLQAEALVPGSGAALRELAEIHQADLSVFGADGRLLSTAVPFLYEQGWQPERINPAALRAFQQQGFKPALLNERAGELEYLAAYAPVRQSGQTVDYFFQIPFAPSSRSLQDNVLKVMGQLLNLYVFLLLIAGAIAIAVANSITRPLMTIGEKLRSFQLGKNEPLEWGTEDEIGKLVAAYNAMIGKLEESAAQLRQSEREGAWREMAKQVAHEIKNPLTPMKLSIQYLQHAQKSDPERAAMLIERVSATMIEQIDGLAKIATEFSHFAKMPKAQNEPLLLNEVLESVHRLFTEHQSPEAEISLSLPEASARVFADRAQLVRVLTNLVKNAQQAIPEGRQGRIELALNCTDGMATVIVKDNGTGIPEAVQPKVFEPNFTTKSSGMGLGLAMCKNIVEEAQGRLYFETEAEVGTRFILELPLID